MLKGKTTLKETGTYLQMQVLLELRLLVDDNAVVDLVVDEAVEDNVVADNSVVCRCCNAC